ncbi:heterokaryon incompatibility protein-domain-containing protein, partial [Phaeosphaeria sp. MPI-PUGE-AT-0046c]
MMSHQSPFHQLRYGFGDERFNSDWIFSKAAYVSPSMSMRAAFESPKSPWAFEPVEENWARTIVLCTPPDADPVYTFWMPFPLQEVPNYTAARAWLNECQTNHGADCNSLSNPVQGMHLIDVLDSRIVDVKDLLSPRWLALSYVWGNATHCPPIQISGTDMLPDHLPKTVEDAIEVTKRLDYRYLWVDELCIDQLDPSHRASQVRKMDLIYQGADLTIVASYGDNKNCGLPGVGTTPRMEHPVVHIDSGTVFSIGPDPRSSLRSSTWWTRAWTFQEGYLSKRLLVFTDHQMTFFCRQAAWMEALPLPPDRNSAALNADLSHLWTSLWDLRSSPYIPTPLPPLIRFETLIIQYIDRDMSDPRDALNAAAGVLHHLGQGDDQVLNFVGLPYYRGPKGAEIPI